MVIQPNGICVIFSLLPLRICEVHSDARTNIGLKKSNIHYNLGSFSYQDKITQELNEYTQTLRPTRAYFIAIDITISFKYQQGWIIGLCKISLVLLFHLRVLYDNEKRNELLLISQSLFIPLTTFLLQYSKEQLIFCVS